MEDSKDLISRQAAIDEVKQLYEWHDTVTEDRLINHLKRLPSAQPDNQINLCDSCDYSYPDCPSKNDDVIFGNDIGNDNICACNKYKPSAQPEQSESEDITFWKKRAREYEEMVLKLTDEKARGIKIDSVLITEEGIVFKKKKQEQRWILCEKRMPETDDEVLITVLDMEDDYVEVYKGFYQDHEWWTQWCHGCLKIKDEPCGVNIVTAWMPLPDPYREEGETDG